MRIICTVVLLVCCFSLSAQGATVTVQETEPALYRDYQLLIGGWGDVQNAVTNCRTISKMLFDGYYRLVEPAIKNELLKNSL